MGIGLADAWAQQGVSRSAWALTALGAIALLAVLSRRAGAVFALALALSFSAGVFSMHGRLAEARASGPWLEPIDLEGRVAEPVLFASRYRLDLIDVVAVDRSDWRVPRRIRVYGEIDPAQRNPFWDVLPGERVRARVRLREPTGLRNPGGRDTELRLRRAGIGATGRLEHPALHVHIARPGWKPLHGLHRLRRELAARMEAAGQGGSLLNALALGWRSGLPADTRDAFAALGLSHLLAVSGLHLSLLAAMAYAFAARAFARCTPLTARFDTRRFALAFAVVVAAAYALLAGFGVPVRRALVLLLAAAFALAGGRGRRTLHALSAAALWVLAGDPAALFDAGAQLSFVATAALLLAVRRRDPIEAATEVRARWRRALEETLRATATASLATAPWVAFHLGIAAPLAVLTNLVAVPFTALCLLPAALFAACVATLSQGAVSDALLGAAERIGAFSLATVEIVAERVPDASVAPPTSSRLILACLLCGLVLRTASTRLRVMAAIAVSLVLAWLPPAPILPAAPRLVALDVGQGDATLIQGRNASILVDAGTKLPTGLDMGRRVVVPALRALGVKRLDLLVVTHADLDHRGGVPSVLEAFPVDAVWLPHGASNEDAFEALWAAAETKRVPVFERGVEDQPLELGDLRITPLWPPRADSGQSRNDRSLVLRIDVAHQRILLPGDIEHSAEMELIQTHSLAADFLKLPHHGSKTSSSAGFIRAVNPDVVLASAACAGRFAMPHPSVQRRVAQQNASLYWTGRDGAILVGLADRPFVHTWSPPRRHCTPAQFKIFLRVEKRVSRRVEVDGKRVPRASGVGR